MNRIKIQPEIWGDAPAPICTRLVNLDAAEQLLYQAMKIEYGYTDEDIIRFTETEEQSYEKEKWCERLCKEEEAVIIECGGVYYEDMTNEDPNPTIYERLKEIKLQEQKELTDILKKYGHITSSGHEYKFEENSPVIAAYSHDEPHDIVVLAVSLDNGRLAIYAVEKDSGTKPEFYGPDDVFAGQLEFVTSDIIHNMKTTLS